MNVGVSRNSLEHQTRKSLYMLIEADHMHTRCNGSGKVKGEILAASSHPILITNLWSFCTALCEMAKVPEMPCVQILEDVSLMGLHGKFFKNMKNSNVVNVKCLAQN
jgi:hypothetical protein